MMIDKLVILLFLLGLSACNTNPMPIDADDFGFPKFTINAAGYNVSGSQENELSQWKSTGYAYNGADQVVIMVYNDYNSSISGQDLYFSQWTSWFCEGESSICPVMQGAPTCIIPSPGPGDPPGNKYENITNAPCIFKQGMGLYMLLQPQGSQVSPNQNSTVIRNPSASGFYTLGLWQQTSMYSNGNVAYGYLGSLDSAPVTNSNTGASYPSSTNFVGTYGSQDGALYLKILDRYYDDNAGSYYVSLKSGFQSIKIPPIASVINAVTGALNTATATMYQNLIVNSEYLNDVRLVMLIYMMVQGVLYLGGFMHMNQTDLVKTFLRITVIITLVAPNSWDFFNQYFFQFFTSGMGEMINLVSSSLQVGDGTGGSGASSITFFDNIFDLLFSYETSMKIIALICSVPSGIVAAIIMYVAFIIFIIAIAQAVMLYLLAYVAISLLISLAPIFLIFLLFERTKSLFEGWWSQMLIYFVQPIIVFASLSLLGNIIISLIYKILGFPACYYSWISVPFPSNSDPFVIASSWQICSISSQRETIAVPGYNLVYTTNASTGQVTSQLYAPYSLQAERYIDLPFLDPNASTADGLFSDPQMIQAFSGAGTGAFINALNMPMLYYSFIMLITTGLMFTFNQTIPALASGLVGATGGSSMKGVADSMVRQLGQGSLWVTRKVAKGIQSAAKGLNNIRKGVGNNNVLGESGPHHSGGTGKSALGGGIQSGGLFGAIKSANEGKDAALRTGVDVAKKIGHFGYNAAEFLGTIIVPKGSLTFDPLEERLKDEKNQLDKERKKRINTEGTASGSEENNYGTNAHLNSKFGKMLANSKYMPGAKMYAKAKNFDEKFNHLKENITKTLMPSDAIGRGLSKVFKNKEERAELKQSDQWNKQRRAAERKEGRKRGGLITSKAKKEGDE